MPGSTAPFEALVIGASSGGVELLTRLLPALSAAFPAPVIVCLHAAPGTTVKLAELLHGLCALAVCEADDKQTPQAGSIYIAPGGYHLLIERTRSFSLSLDPPVRYSRPSIDVLLETAAAAYENRLVASILTGANADGAAGARVVKELGGYVIVQQPESASAPAMPEAALRATEADAVLMPEALAPAICRLFQVSGSS